MTGHQPGPADGLEPAVVFCAGGQAFNIQVPVDSGQFSTWIKVVRSDGMLLLPDAAIPWHAVVSVLKGSALASLYRSIGDAHLTQQMRPGEKPN